MRRLAAMGLTLFMMSLPPQQAEWQTYQCNADGCTILEPSFALACPLARCMWGIQQTVATEAGTLCEVRVEVASISTDSVYTTRETTTRQDRMATTWRINVDLAGGDDPLARGLISSQPTTQDGVFTFSFIAAGPTTTVYIEQVFDQVYRYNSGRIRAPTIVCQP